MEQVEVNHYQYTEVLLTVTTSPSPAVSSFSFRSLPRTPVLDFPFCLGRTLPKETIGKKIHGSRYGVRNSDLLHSGNAGADDRIFRDIRDLSCIFGLPYSPVFGRNVDYWSSCYTRVCLAE